MPKKPTPKELSNIVTQHQAQLQKIAANWADGINSNLSSTDTEMIKYIQEQIKKFGTVGLDKKTEGRFMQMAKDIRVIRQKSYDDAITYVAEQSSSLAANEVKWAAAYTTAVTGETVKKITQQAISDLTKFGSYSGHTIQEWFTNIADKEVFNIMGIARNGLANGESMSAMVGRIMGTPGIKGVLDTTRIEATTLARTACNGVANDAKAIFYEANQDVIVGYKFYATLDFKTSEVCSFYDQTIWTDINEVKWPPLHPNAVLPSSLIYTDKGLKPISQIKIGDKVLTHTGKYRKVYNIMRKTNDTPMVKLINNFGECICLTTDHPILTLDRGWIEAGDVKSGDVFFHNAKQLSASNMGISRSYITNSVLINSNNIETAVTKELIALNIFNISSTMPPSIKFKHYISAFKEKIGNVLPMLILKNKINTMFGKFINNKFFVKSWISPVSRNFCFHSLFNCFIIPRRIFNLHSFGRCKIAFLMPLRVFSRPMIFSSRLWGKLLTCNNRFSFASSFNPEFNTSFSNNIIRKSMFTLNKPKTFSLNKMFGFNKINDFFIGCKRHLANLHFRCFYTSTCTSIVEYNHIGEVFNLSVEKDETFFADSFLVHNCRSIVLPETELSDKGTRPSANADFDRLAQDAYEEKYPDKKFSDLSASTRDKYYYQAQKDFEEKTGKPAYSQVSNKTSFSEWFENQSAADQKSWLGATRYELYKKGDMTIDKFVNPATDKAFTIAELKERDKAAFAKIK